MITLALIILTGVCNAVMDTLMVFFTTSRFRKLNPLFWDFNKSWINKWKNGDKAQGEKFWGSSTFFVAFTDVWHLFKTIMIFCLIGAIVLYQQIFNQYIDAAILLCTFLGSFELSYRIFKREI